tara:strand:- start:2041 stop:3564 length:1524 start_codon:yes stop_codon:yes gene_type:complete
MLNKKFDEKLRKEASLILKQKKSLTENITKLDKSFLIHQIDNLTVDLSRNFVNKNILSYLYKAAYDLNLKSKIKKLFLNKHRSISENKLVSFIYNRHDKKNYEKKISEMYLLHDGIKSGEIVSCSNEKFKHIVHIGIGGSILGSKALSHALASYSDHLLDIHYVSSADSSEINYVLGKCDISRTLFIFMSKSFQTREVLLNYEYIKNKLQKLNYGNKIYKNFFAVTANVSNALKYKIPKNNIITFSKNIPGRFSITSPISFTLLLEVGKKNYRQFINGVLKIDSHFKNKKIEKNIPILLGLLSVWNINYLNITTHCVNAYAYKLRSLSDYIQQIEMESNGKSVNNNNHKISYNTAPFLFGQEGTECQHSFFQMVHQGSLKMSADFIGIINSNNSESSNFLLANLIAQSNLLYSGKENNHSNMNINGNCPSNIILLDSITPYALGMLMTIYDHKVITEGLLWNINSFDQWGVEEGKKSSSNIQKKIINKSKLNKDDIIIKLIKKKIKK